jgi:hypothetical protein
MAQCVQTSGQLIYRFVVRDVEHEQIVFGRGGQGLSSSFEVNSR